MRECSPDKFSTTALLSGAQSTAKSLFWNILAISPYGSRFCADSTLYQLHKFLRMNILGKQKKKIVDTGYPFFNQTDQLKPKQWVVWMEEGGPMHRVQVKGTGRLCRGADSIVVAHKSGPGSEELWASCQSC